MYCLVIYQFVIGRKVVLHKRLVFVFRDGLQHHHVSTVVKWTCSIKENLVHDVTFTSSKDEVRITAMLNMST
jgi:hypothetical protein